MDRLVSLRDDRAAGLVLIGLAAMIIGAWGPWVAHANAAMSLSALDLAEFVKFMQRAALTSVMREWFCLPLVSAAIGLALWARKIHFLNFHYRLVGLLGAAALTLMVLPPYPDLLRAYRLPEDRIFFWMGVGAFALTLLAGSAGAWLPRRAAAAAWLVLAVGSTTPALWQLAQLSAPLAQLYGAPLQMGWGVIVTVAGGLSVTAGAAAMLAR